MSYTESIYIRFGLLIKSAAAEIEHMRHSHPYNTGLVLNKLRTQNSSRTSHSGFIWFQGGVQKKIKNTGLDFFKLARGELTNPWQELITILGNNMMSLLSPLLPRTSLTTPTHFAGLASPPIDAVLKLDTV